MKYKQVWVENVQADSFRKPKQLTSAKQEETPKPKSMFKLEYPLLDKGLQNTKGKFEVRVVETMERIIVVDAETAIEARDQIYDKWENGQFHLNPATDSHTIYAYGIEYSTVNDD